MSLVQRTSRRQTRPQGRRLHLGIVRRILSRLDCGAITIVLPDERTIEFTSTNPGPEAVLIVKRWRTIWRTLTRGDMGFAEAYIDGDCSSPDIAKVVELFVRNQSMLERMAGFAPVHFLNRIFHRRRANTKSGSRRNIVAHYDLGNEFFRHWLDEGMTYSSALYADPCQTLEQAQAAKQDRILADLDLRQGQKILEIGCGWGGLAERMLAKACEVTGVTLSPSQLAYANARLQHAGLAPGSDLRLQDYRDVTGTYDRIVSIEMMEAVGIAYWPIYFASIRERLARDGRAVLQVITLDETRYEGYRDQVDFIQRYIFPGGMLPTPTIMREQIAAAGLTLHSTFCFGQSYATTLSEWARRFEAAWPKIEAMGFDARFRRLWTYYLAYCEGGFRAGALDVGLYTITHAA